MVSSSIAFQSGCADPAWIFRPAAIGAAPLVVIDAVATTDTAATSTGQDFLTIIAVSSRGDSGGQIASTRANVHARRRHPHLERVHFAIEQRRREAERVLVMQFVGDALERGRHVAGGGQLEVPAAGCL